MTMDFETYCGLMTGLSWIVGVIGIGCFIEWLLRGPRR